MNQDMSILSLVLHASWVVQAVMLLLLGVSVASWTAIMRKLFSLARVKKLNDVHRRIGVTKSGRISAYQYG